MRILVFVLVVANGLFFAFSQTQGQPSPQDAQRLKQQVSPERIQIVKDPLVPAEGNAGAPAGG